MPGREEFKREYLESIAETCSKPFAECSRMERYTALAAMIRECCSGVRAETLRRRAAAGDILRPCALYLLISACESGTFFRKQRCHLLCRCQTGHGNGVVVPERLPVPGDAG